MRSKLLMIIASLAIVVGLIGLFSPKQQDTPVTLKQKEPEPPAYFKVYQLSKAGVKRGDIVDRRDLTIVKMSEDQANTFGIHQDMLFDYESGSVYQKEMLQGTPVFSDDIIQPSEARFIDFVIKPDHVPYSIEVTPSTIVGGVIDSGSHIDILSLTGLGSNGRNSSERKIALTPVLTNVKVLKVAKNSPKLTSQVKKSDKSDKSYLVLELDRKQVAILTIAKSISKIEVHKSIGQYSIKDLQANAGDVLPDFKAIKELRANKVVVK